MAPVLFAKVLKVGGGGSSARVNARAEKLEIRPGAENELKHSLNE